MISLVCKLSGLLDVFNKEESFFFYTSLSKVLMMILVQDIEINWSHDSIGIALGIVTTSVFF